MVVDIKEATPADAEAIQEIMQDAFHKYERDLGMTGHVKALQETVEEYSGQGERVLLLTRHEGPITGGKLTGKLSPMALIRIANKIRPEAPDTFRYFAQQGVAVKVISGDNPVTVSQVALRAGIQGAEQYVDAATLKSDADIARAVEQYTVFGRVTPSQKRKFVQALKKAGHTVAMTVRAQMCSR